jgi:hypothetical protein
MVKHLFGAVLATLLVAGCVSSPNTDNYQFSCASGGECPDGQTCQAGLCVPIFDGGTDAGPDGGLDAGPDGGPDAGADAGPDAGTDGGSSGGDGGPDSGSTCDPQTAFSSARAVNVGINPGGIVVGDFNHDGFLDYAVTDWGDGGFFTGRLNIFLGDGGDGFGRVIVPVGPAIEAVATANITHSGWPDIVVVSAETDSFGIVTYDGDGGFAVVDSYIVGPDAGGAYQPNYGPVAVAVADLNRDGFDDVVLADFYPSAVSILYGSADAGLSKPTVLFTPLNFVYLNGLAVGDLDHDQLPDLVLAGGDGYVYVALSMGDAGYGPFNGYQGAGGVGCSYPQCGAADVALADVNGDGYLDAIVPETTANEVDVFFNDQTGGLLTPPLRLSTLSADGDGGIGPLGVSVADFNGDGILDIMSAEGSPYPDYSNGCLPVNGYNQSLTFFAGSRDAGGGYGATQVWVRAAPNGAPRWLAAGQFRQGAAPDLLVSYLNEILVCDSSGLNCEGGLCGFEGTQANLYPNACY